MGSLKTNDQLECSARYPLLRSQRVKAGIFFVNFFLVITTLYQLKPASRSLFIESLGSARLPYIWIAVALSMGIFISVYHQLVSRFNRQHIVMGSTLAFGVALLAFRFWFFFPGKAVTVCFYVFVDILGVVLVEQFWSLVNSIYSTREGKSWYGFVGTGGLLGGVTGGGLAALLLHYTRMTTYGLLISAAATLFIIFTVTTIMGRFGLFCEVDGAGPEPGPEHEPEQTGPPVSFKRYLILIAAMLLLSQLLSPVIDFIFMNRVESAYTNVEARTTFLSLFFSLSNIISIGVNLLVTPLIHRLLGPIAGLVAQPLVIIISSSLFLFNATLFYAGSTKIGDRGLSYSINRASRELLYVPIGSLLIYRAKAWIDMLGYRLFKGFGSVIILLVAWLAATPSRLGYLSIISVTICVVWLVLIGLIRKEYQAVQTEG
jgi:ATP:ADP antiporter, AAA family